ncbi:DNA polymerase beta [Magnaporthiopsis poae ATCC 64411]|uniref:DNA polymerase n=1 Tax=Magnaporthiopsis poae (strain ATCC 64411 / 73-15) TaxID=644358 RepID=A0A0C4DVC8_MAGP6|nr:DNA polymerase beta [Magnaporthiopsis poae ATCC 64411]
MALQFPLIYLLSTHLGADELRGLEAQIPTITYNAHEAEVVLGNISRRERAMFELRRLGLNTSEIPTSGVVQEPAAKRRRVSAGHPSAASDKDEVQLIGSQPLETDIQSIHDLRPNSARVAVVKVAWFTDCNTRGEILPLDDYILYQGIKFIDNDKVNNARSPPLKLSAVLQRSQSDVVGPSSQQLRARRQHFAGTSSWKSSSATQRHSPKRPSLLHQTTSEHEAAEHMPPVPDFLHTLYSCQRPTRIHPPNEAFIEQLAKIKTTRLLTGDKVGVRAYSSAIASLAAYPYLLTSPEEVDRLPGCGPKIALLFQEFNRQGVVREAQEAESDPKLPVLKQFYDVWGVGEVTAKEWYDRGWRDLDDVVEYGWETLTRVQQIGIKFYDEFLLKIPREEVESIANTVLEHANRHRSGFQMVIVGGYRRGKKESGDVDIILSHPDEAATHNFITHLVVALENSNYITHTLILSTRNSERGQVTLGWKGEVKKAPGTGFDTLDKALVVWQDPNWTPDGDENNTDTKNPNPHRRVDIIISPWKTAGCAVLSWTSGTTFQRDLRRYCKRERGLKFDSSGIRSRTSGRWVDFESGEDGSPAPDMETAEKRVFAGLGLEWRAPEERSTG